MLKKFIVKNDNFITVNNISQITVCPKNNENQLKKPTE